MHNTVLCNNIIHTALKTENENYCFMTGDRLLSKLCWAKYDKRHKR